MEIRIACSGNTTVDINTLYDLQGELKDLSETNYHKLHDSIVKFGFSFPIFLWIDPADGRNYILDAHQRVRTLKKMRDEEGYIIPPLPADIIEADSLTQAKEKLLLLNSHYGQMTQVGFDEFTADIPLEDVSDLLALDDVVMPGQDISVAQDNLDDTKKSVTCPSCGHIFTPNTDGR